MTEVISKLLCGEDWLRLAVRVRLHGERGHSLDALKDSVLQDDRIKALLRDVSDYHHDIVSTHKNPGLAVNKLLFLLDIGLDASVPEIRAAILSILSHKDSRGVYQSLVNIPKHFGGSGQDTFGWSLCDAPLLLLALARAKVPYETHLKQGVEFLVSLFENGAFPCAGSDELGKFRGPGRREDCCPFATLSMLRLLYETDEYRESAIAASCAEKLLWLFENSLTQHPYLFYMGTDFRKLKAPPVWYDLVAVLDCLSLSENTVRDARFATMLSLLEDKRDENGMFTPESVYLKCKDWDFGQKKGPSPYLTFLCLRILQRAGRDI